MLIFKNIKILQQHLSSLSADKAIGFVPTMGALHQGHLSLIKEAKEQNDIVIVSIFVNPTQFDKQEDLEKYPRTLDADIELLKSINCDVVFTPNSSDIYDKNIQSDSFDFDGLEHLMEGEFRNGHFDGVGTIVKRFFEIVKPTNAYFGEKDFQQLQIIRKMVEKHHIPVNIIGCKIFREEDGLAMSSRNLLLSKEQRLEASLINKILNAVKAKFEIKNTVDITDWVIQKFEKHPVLRLEYFQIADESTLQQIVDKENNHQYRAFIAVFAGNIRLIDNIKL